MTSKIKLFLAAIGTVCSLSFASAESAEKITVSDYDTKLINTVNEINKNAPVMIGQSGFLKNTEYKDKRFSMYMMMNDNYINFDALKNNRSLIKQNAMSTLGSKFSNEGTSNLMSMLSDANASFYILYQAMVSGDTISVTLTAEEVYMAQKASTEAEEDPEKLLEAQVETSNIHLPIQLDEITLMTKVSMDKKAIIYDYSIDESKASMSLLKKNKKTVKNNIYASMKPQIFTNLCKKTKRDIIHRYTGDQTGESFTITVPNKDIP